MKINAIRKTFVPHLALLFILAILSACASTPQQAQEDPAVTLAKARWNALLAGDLKEAYGYLAPGYRSKMTYEDYVVAQRLRRVKLTSAEYVEHSCEGKTCTLRFKTGFSVRGAVPGVDVYDGWNWSEERWLKIDGGWWYLPEK